MTLKDLARTARAIAATARLPPRFPPGHYYSALTSPHDVERAIAWAHDKGWPAGIEVDRDAMARLAKTLAPMWTELDQASRYSVSEMYCESDAAIYQSIIRYAKPQRIIEVGSGFSTAVALDTIHSAELATHITCIEPYPERLKSLLKPSDNVIIRDVPVQDVELDVYDQLHPNDILFIDSTHVAKPASDVIWNFLHVLPRVAPGVIVHIHDIFWPFEYQESWLRERRDWNEIYFLHAFLIGNPAWKVMFFNDFIWQTMPDLITQTLPTTLTERPGGFWMQRQ